MGGRKNAAKLYWGGSITVDGYEIKAEDFNEDKMVFVSISKDGEKLKTAPLTAGLEFEYDDEIKVYAQNVDPNYEVIEKDGKEFKTGNWNPYAELDILIRGKPSFNIAVETDKETYDPDSRIDLTITVKNDGDAEAENVVLNVDTLGMEVLSGKAKHTYSNVLKEETLETINLTLKAAAPWEDTKYNITATTTCEDSKGEKHEHVGYKEITVEKKWDVVISKNSVKERHMGETIPVSVNVRNEGLCDIDDIVLKDSILSDMHLQDDVTLEKTLSLESGEAVEDVFKYTLIPEKPGEFTLPAVAATFPLPTGRAEKRPQTLRKK